MTDAGVIPFHEGEEIRVEMGRVTIVDDQAVRPSACRVLIGPAGGVRSPLHGCQACVIRSRGDQRIVTLVVHRKHPDVVEQLDDLTGRSETDRFDIELAVGSSDRQFREYVAHNCRMLVTTADDDRVVLEFIE